MNGRRLAQTEARVESVFSGSTLSVSVMDVSQPLESPGTVKLYVPGALKERPLVMKGN
jgi:hypothetical protein